MQKRVYQTRNKKNQPTTVHTYKNVDHKLMTTMIFICCKIKNQTKKKQKTIIESFWLPYQNRLYKSRWMGILERVLESSIKKKNERNPLKKKERKKKKNA